jgi:hypothetical protein
MAMFVFEAHGGEQPLYGEGESVFAAKLVDCMNAGRFLNPWSYREVETAPGHIVFNIAEECARHHAVRVG